MLSLPPNVGIYLYSAPVDMRRSFDGLSVLVMDVLEQNPLSGSLFVFLNRSGDKLKLLYYDGQGLCLFYKRLERGRFYRPEAAVDGVELSSQQLRLLLDGLAISLANEAPKNGVEILA